VKGDVIDWLLQLNASVAASYFNVAGYCRQQNYSPVVLHTVSMMGGAVCTQANSGYLFRMLRRIFLYQLFQVIKAYRPFLRELFVIETFIDNHVHHTQCQGAVGARSQLEVYISHRGDSDTARVDNNELETILSGFNVFLP